MITPKELENNVKTTDLQKIEEEIDASLKRFHGWYPWEQAIITGECSLSIRNDISKKYIENGWNFVYHRTSSEHGEFPGLTTFKLSITELDPLYVKGYHICTK